MSDQITKEDLSEVKSAVKENTRALRGTNGNPGIVADISTMRRDIKDIVETKLPSVERNIKADLLLAETRILAYIDKKFSEQSSGILHDWVRPVILPIFIALVTALLTIWVTGETPTV